MQTQVPSGASIAVKKFSVAAFGRIVEAPSFMKDNTGPAPTISDASANLKGQTAPGMPIVRVTDLSKAAGEKVSVDAFDTLTGKPIMGDANKEGKGVAISYSSMDISINKSSFVIDAGGEMAQQRTVHNLRSIGLAGMEGYFPRLHSQRAIVQMAGARGSQVGNDWIVPLTTDSDYTSIMINSVRAPTYNRHFVIDGSSPVQGGAQLASINSTDIWTLDIIDSLSLLWDDLPIKMQSVRVDGDRQSMSNPIKGILYLTPRQMFQLTTQNSGRNWSDMVKYAYARKSGMSTPHPLFDGDVGVWKGILVRQLPSFVVRFAKSEAVPHITSANRYTATETNVTVNSGLTTGYAVERALFLGAQALGYCFGRNQNSDYYFRWSERPYNHGDNLEISGTCMDGASKLRFDLDNGTGTKEPTDLGIMVIDSAVKL